MHDASYIKKGGARYGLVTVPNCAGKCVVVIFVNIAVFVKDYKKNRLVYIGVNSLCCKGPT